MSNDVPAAHAPAEDCAGCPLRQSGPFEPLGAAEVALIARLKQAELDAEPGALLIAEGADDAPLYTLLEGWAFRFKTLPDGRRQILDFLLPGDFIGLQHKLDDAASHGVRALTAVRLCRFRRDTVWTLHRECAALGYSLTWLAARGEGVVDDNLLSVGRRSALERVAALLLLLAARHAALAGTPPGAAMPWPLTQGHVADAMGLSLVHVSRVMRALTARGLVVATMRPATLRLPDPAALAALARLRWPLQLPLRPLI